MPLTFAQVALGDEIEVPTLNGKVKLKIPAGTQTGTNFRLREKRNHCLLEWKWSIVNYRKLLKMKVLK